MAFQRFLEAVNTRDHRLHRRVIDDGDFALVVQHLRHQFARFLATLVVVGADVGKHFYPFGGHVNGDDLDACLLRLLNGGQYTLAVHRRDDQHVHALDDHVFNIGELLAEILVGDGDFQRHVLRLGFRLHRIGKLDIKRVLLGEQGRTDTVRPGRAGSTGEEGCRRQRGHFA